MRDPTDDLIRARLLRHRSRRGPASTATTATIRRATFAFAGLAAIAVAGCGDDGSATSTSAGPAAGTTQAGLPAATIGARDYAYDGVPATVTEGTPIEITNTSATEAHELTAFRLPDGETRDLDVLTSLPPEELGALLPGAPALALVARPGAAGELVLGDGSLREPGRYLLVCFVPMGAKPDEVVAAMKQAAADPAAGPPQIAGGPPHLTAGMIAEIEVVP